MDAMGISLESIGMLAYWSFCEKDGLPLGICLVALFP
jgi:hypothetical protein